MPVAIPTEAAVATNPQKLLAAVQPPESTTVVDVELFQLIEAAAALRQ
jgi:hypothetical protein